MDNSSLIHARTSARGRFVSEFSGKSWKTAEGQVFRLAYMETSHLFYAFRMLYDLTAERYGWPNMRPPREGRQASPDLTDEYVAKRMAWFATDIIARGDLEEPLAGQFRQMMRQIQESSTATLPSQTRNQIPPGDHHVQHSRSDH